MTTGDYGIIRTDFTVEEIYQMEDSIWLILDYDYNNGKIHELRIVPRQEKNRERAISLALALLDGLLPKSTQAQPLSAAQILDAMEESQTAQARGAYTYTAWPRGDLELRLCTLSGRKPAVDHCIRCSLYWNQHPALSGKRPGLSLVMIFRLVKRMVY